MHSMVENENFNKFIYSYKKLHYYKMIIKNGWVGVTCHKKWVGGGHPPPLPGGGEGQNVLRGGVPRHHARPDRPRRPAGASLVKP